MQRSFLTCVLLCLRLVTEGFPQPADGPSWQWLRLQLGSSFNLFAKDGRADPDSCLLDASRTLGLSRLPVLAEGIGDSALLIRSQWVDRRDPGVAFRLLPHVSGKRRMNILLLLAAYYAFEPGGHSRYRDSIEYFLTGAQRESRILKDQKAAGQALCLLVKVYAQMDAHGKKDSVFSRLLEITRASGDQETEARAFGYRGIYTRYSTGTAKEKIADLQQAAAIYRDLGIAEGEICAMANIGYLTGLPGQAAENIPDSSGRIAAYLRPGNKTTRIVTISGIAAAVVIAGLLYWQNRIRRRSSRVITQKNDQLQQLLNEKEWLLREIHHRVGNNLQIVMSLLNSQSAFIDNETALAAIQNSQHRVHAMSLIHQKLYYSENVASIEMPVYIRELTSYLREVYITGQRIRFVYDIDPLELDVSQAVPVGLILNEAITNSIRYAFPNGRDGVITITLKKADALRYQLGIADDGVGIPYEYSGERTRSLGMRLMAGLTDDLDGKFFIGNNSGTTIKISFIPELCIKRSGPVAATFVSTN
ncbi:sensor histidine kinase [Puia sp. P3]|uniref:sensor histidine kinase n=1 Tax=Puia sp. P3 TaxID=3423952 RepID=UPI003D6679A2